MKDAMRSYMNYVKSAEIKFVDPNVQMFYDDEAQGLCTIEVKPGRRSQDGLPSGDSELLIHYYDPELEFQRRLQT